VLTILGWGKKKKRLPGGRRKKDENHWSSGEVPEKNNQWTNWQLRRGISNRRRKRKNFTPENKEGEALRSFPFYEGEPGRVGSQASVEFRRLRRRTGGTTKVSRPFATAAWGILLLGRGHGDNP